ncbi:MAG: efflux RND transporter permease subunit, partial [Spirulinaceae cyanobacterium]
MSFHVSSWSIKNPVPTIVMFLVLGIFGIFSFLQLGIDSEPNIDVPAVIISVGQPGAGPAELENQVTKEIEDAVAGLGNIDKITSTVVEGSSTTVVEFTLDTDTDRATNDVRNAVSQVRSKLPQDVNDPIVSRLEFAGGSVMTYAVSSPQRSVEELSDLVDRKISRALLTVRGVAEVNRKGGVDREIRVDLDPSRLQAYGITATQVNDQIRSLNINLPSGRSEIGGGEQNVRTLGSAETVEDLQDYGIVLPNGDSVRLSDLGEVTDSFADPRQSAYLNGEPVVSYSVLRSTGSNLVTVEEGVKKKVEELKTTLPEDIKQELIFTRADEVRASYQATIGALIAGCLLTIVTVWLFLRDWRVTLITALALPLSMIPTFMVMKTLDYTLNGMTLLALALAVGNLVDDAICMIENIDQHLQMGKRPFKAALDGAREIGLAVVATTATIVAVFVPVAFMGGIPGQFFQPFGITVAVSTMFSTLVAVTMTPMLSAYLLQPKYTNTETNGHNPNFNGNGHHKPPQKRFHPYRNLLTWSLKHRITTLIVAVVFFIGSLQLIQFIPKGLFDSGDIGISIVSIDLPAGSQLQETEAVLAQLNEILLPNPNIKSVLGTLGGDSVDQGTAVVSLVPKSERDLHQREIEQQMRQEFARIPGARVSFQSQGPGGGSKELSIVLQSENAETLNETAEALESQMKEIPGLVEVVSSTSLVKPEIIIEPDAARAADLGVSVQAISRTASLALIGDSESNLAKFNLADRQIPIRVKIASDATDDLETLKNLMVPRGDGGGLVPLTAVANIRLGSGPAEIERLDRSRQVLVEANLEGVSLGDALDQVK